MAADGSKYLHVQQKTQNSGEKPRFMPKIYNFCSLHVQKFFRLRLRCTIRYLSLRAGARSFVETVVCF